MRAVGVKMLKNRLSEYIRLVSAGETVLVTDRDRIVAEIIPPRSDRSPTLDDASLADMVRNGLLTPPLRRQRTPPRRLPIAPLEKILRELEADREDR